MKNSHTSQALALAFATFLIELRHSLMANDFSMIVSLPDSLGYRKVTLYLGNFILHFSISHANRSLVHHCSSSSFDLSPFIDEFGYDFFSDLLSDR